MILTIGFWNEYLLIFITYNGSPTSCTLLSYAGNIYASHKEQKALDDLLEVIDREFKIDTPNLSITRGLNHNYIGMNIDISGGVDYVWITQYNFLEDILDETTTIIMKVWEGLVWVSDVFTTNAIIGHRSSRLFPSNHHKIDHYLQAREQDQIYK